MSPLSRPSLRKFFAQFSSARVRLPKAPGNLFEFYVFLQTCTAARASGHAVSLVSPIGSTYVVRASPGGLGGKYGFATITTSSGTTYELHNGVELTGHSSMDHEADLFLLGPPGTLAGAVPYAAASGGRPLMLAGECKLYQSASRLKGEVRKVVGAVVDWSAQAHASLGSGAAQGCLHCGLGFGAFFVTSVPSGRRPDIERFLAAYDVMPCFGALQGGGPAQLRARLQGVLSALP